MKRYLSKFIHTKWSIKVLLIWALIALLAPIIANNKAIFRIDDEGVHFPIFSSSSFDDATANFELYPLIRYDHQSMDYAAANPAAPQLSKSDSSDDLHLLGTDQLGRDVLANLIYGSRTAFFIGFGSMLLAALLGILLGGIAAYFGDHQVQIKKGILYSFLLCFLLWSVLTLVIVPWSMSTISFSSKLLSVIVLLFVFSLFFLFLTKISFIQKSKKITLPIDLIIGRFIDVMESIPLLFLLIALSTIFIQSIASVIVVIGLVAWPTIAKYTRAEFMKVKNTLFIENAVALGLPRRKIIFKHILSNAINPVLVTLAFGLGSSILLESTLSFLGLGIDSETASWGKMLASARQYYQAWWLVVFPGFAIFISIISCNSLGDYLSKQR